MTIVQTLAIFVAMHVAFGVVQLAMFYFSSDIVTYGGEAGFLSYTPLRSIVGDGVGQQADLLDVKALFGHIADLGDTVYGLLSFEYEIVTDIAPSDGLVYWVALVFRMVSWFSTLAVTISMAQLIFSSGILQSTAGLALVLGGIGITGALAALGVTS